MSADTDSSRSAVKTLVEKWTAAFIKKDVPTLRALWDDKYDGLVYQAEEFAAPLVTWLHIKHYYRDVLGLVLEKVEKFERTGLWIDVLGDVAFAYTISDAVMMIAHSPDPYKASVRQTFVVRKVSGAWKIIHYHESLQTMPTPEVLKLDEPDPS